MGREAGSIYMRVLPVFAESLSRYGIDSAILRSASVSRWVDNNLSTLRPCDPDACGSRADLMPSLATWVTTVLIGNDIRRAFGPR